MDSPTSTSPSSTPGSSRSQSPSRCYNSFVYDPSSQISYLSKQSDRAVSLMNSSYSDTSTAVFFVHSPRRSRCTKYQQEQYAYGQEPYSIFFGPRSTHNRKNLSLERAVLEGLRVIRWRVEDEYGLGGKMPVLKVIVMTDNYDLIDLKRPGGMKYEIGDELEGIQREVEGLEEDCGVNVCFQRL